MEIDLLCVAKKFRNKGLAPVMIKEVTRRTNLRGIFQAIYTAGMELPNKLTTVQYYHRLLNVKKMASVGFYSLPTNNLSIYEKLYKVPQPVKNNTCVIRAIETKDISSCVIKLNSYLSKFNLTHYFEEENFTHYFMPRPNVIYTYVIEKNNEVTDMISFFIIDNIVLNNDKYKEYKAGYLYYYFNESVKLEELINIALFYAKENKCDVFNILNMFNLETILQECKFIKGNGSLNYYLYNYFHQKYLDVCNH